MPSYLEASPLLMSQRKCSTLVAASAALLLVTNASCRPAPPPRSADEAEEAPQATEVVVASIDPPLPSPGAELRLANSAIARGSVDALEGSIGVALTGDPAAVEVMVRALADAETCSQATTALAFLPRSLVRRPLWLALRLDCASSGAIEVARSLDLQELVEAAQRADELPPAPPTSGDDAPSTSAGIESRCEAVSLTLRALGEDTQLPTLLARLEQETWRLPTNEGELCRDDALSAAIRLRRGDRAVRLAFDLTLSSHDELPAYLIEYVDRFGLGRVTPRLLDHEDEADGRLCAALVSAGLLDELLPLLTEEPEAVPRCLHPAALALVERRREADRPALEAVAASARHPGCGAGAIVAALALAEDDRRPPMWVEDAVILGSALAGLLRRSPGGDLPPSAARLRELRAAVEALAPRDEAPSDDSLVRLLQRDLRAVLPGVSGSRRSALSSLLQTGGR
jgi:hypothetical protein